jgi:ferredoxin, 2Fe-2S
MALVIYVNAAGIRHEVQVPNGESVMRGAVDNTVDGIIGQCGGCLACATCHCYVDEAWIARVGAPSEPEAQLLESKAGRRTNSRLSCQITVAGELDGLVVHLPETQD